ERLLHLPARMAADPHPQERTAVKLHGHVPTLTDVDGVADREPADAVTQLGRSAGELRLDRVAALAKVLPALVMNRDRHPRAQQGAELDRLRRGHRVVDRAGDREPDAAEMNQRS